MTPIIQSIQQILITTLSDTTNGHFKTTIGRLPKSQAEFIASYVGADLTGALRILDSSGIRHALRRHGNAVTEATRGQVAITPADFELLPTILQNPESMEYYEITALGHPLFLYTKRVGSWYFVTESVRTSKYGATLVFQTMYKRK